MSTTKAKRTSFYMPAPAQQFLADAEPGTLSSRITGCLLRYERIIREHMPQLSRNEWCAVCDANNGAGIDDMITGETPSLTGLWANVADSDLSEKYDIDQDALVAKMRAWPFASQCAAYEVVRKFWLNTHLDTDEALKLAGATPGPGSTTP